MSDLLLIAGGCAQLAGFVLTYYELSHTLRHEFSDYHPIHQRLADWVRRVAGRRKPVSMYRDAADGSAVTDGASVESYSRPPARSIAERVVRLETAVANVEETQRSRHTATVERFAEVEHRIDTNHSTLRTELAEVERARKANLRASVRIQLVGLVLFTLGTVATTIGGLSG